MRLLFIAPGLLWSSNSKYYPQGYMENKTESIRILWLQQHYRDGTGHAESTCVLLLGIKHDLHSFSIPHHEQTHVLHLLYEVAMDSLYLNVGFILINISFSFIWEFLYSSTVSLCPNLNPSPSSPTVCEPVYSPPTACEPVCVPRLTALLRPTACEPVCAPRLTALPRPTACEPVCAPRLLPCHVLQLENLFAVLGLLLRRLLECLTFLQWRLVQPGAAV